jgi:hypothetical protein
LEDDLKVSPPKLNGEKSATTTSKHVGKHDWIKTLSKWETTDKKNFWGALKNEVGLDGQRMIAAAALPSGLFYGKPYHSISLLEKD